MADSITQGRLLDVVDALVTQTGQAAQPVEDPAPTSTPTAPAEGDDDGSDLDDDHDPYGATSYAMDYTHGSYAKTLDTAALAVKSFAIYRLRMQKAGRRWTRPDVMNDLRLLRERTGDMIAQLEILAQHLDGRLDEGEAILQAVRDQAQAARDEAEPATPATPQIAAPVASNESVPATGTPGRPRKPRRASSRKAAPETLASGAQVIV